MKRTIAKLKFPLFDFYRKLKDLLRASVLCRDMKEMNVVWRRVEDLVKDGIIEGFECLINRTM